MKFFICDDELREALESALAECNSELIVAPVEGNNVVRAAVVPLTNAASVMQPLLEGFGRILITSKSALDKSANYPRDVSALSLGGAVFLDHRAMTEVNTSNPLIPSVLMAVTKVKSSVASQVYENKEAIQLFGLLKKAIRKRTVHAVGRRLTTGEVVPERGVFASNAMATALSASGHVARWKVLT